MGRCAAEVPAAGFTGTFVYVEGSKPRVPTAILDVNAHAGAIKIEARGHWQCRAFDVSEKTGGVQTGGDTFHRVK